MLKQLTLALFAVITSATVIAQDYSAFDCQVEELGKILKYPWTGGFNSPQFSAGDMNMDGREELFVFDRGGDVAMVFEYDGTGGSEGYSYRPDLRLPLPDSLVAWALMRDYNRDGVADLFVAPTFAGISGVQLYVGSFDGENPAYEIKQIGNPDGDFEILWHRFNNNWTNVHAPFTDISDIVDVDGDGDLDVISFDPTGSYVNYYKNFQEERGRFRDEMEFEIVDFCFGKFKESGTSGQLFLSDDDEVCATKKAKADDPIRGGAHAGSTVMCFDTDDDGDVEVLLGDLNSANLVLATNGGTSEDNYMTSVMETFPDYDTPAEMDLFLGSYYVDIDGDGLKDIIAAPNATKSINNVDNVWVYKNTGSTTDRFKLQQKDFLLEETIDLGSLTSPIFVDENADGLMDLIVASAGYYTNLGNSQIFLSLYINIGTKTEPSYKLTDNDYLGFSQYSNSSQDPSPTIGDIDGDGDLDILIGDTQGDLYLYKNSGGPGAPMQFGNPIVEYMEIDLGPRGRPAIQDINGDGLADIIVGERTVNGNFQDPDNATFGSIAYYQNIGSVGDPVFNPEVSQAPNNPALGQMRTQLFTSNAEANSSAPHFIEVEGSLQVLIGSESGRIKRYEVNRNNLSSEFILLDSIVGGIDEGDLTTLSTADIDGDGYLEMVIGNLRGGLGLYNTDILSDDGSSTKDTAKSLGISACPNPFRNNILLTIPTDLQVNRLALINAQGQKIREFNSEARDLEINDLANGIYYLSVETKQRSVLIKLVHL